jgi:hypothetical protein
MPAQYHHRRGHCRSRGPRVVGLAPPWRVEGEHGGYTIPWWLVFKAERDAELASPTTGRTTSSVGTISGTARALMPCSPRTATSHHRGGLRGACTHHTACHCQGQLCGASLHPCRGFCPRAPNRWSSPSQSQPHLHAA